MRQLAVDISYRLFYLAAAAAILYFLPTLVILFGDLATAVFTPVLESVVQNMG